MIMHKILDNLYQGNKDDAIDVSIYNSSIDVLIYIGQELPKELTYESKITVIHIPMKDGNNPKTKWSYLYGTISFFHRVAKKKVLVACRMGLSRSPMMLVLYYSKFKKKCFDESFSFVKEKIPEMNPKPDLYTQIKEIVK